MKQSDDITKIAPAIVQAASELKLVGKTGENTFDKYRYAKLDDYVRIVHPVLAKHGLSAMSSVEQVWTLPERTTKSGNKENAVHVRVTTMLIHASGQWVAADSFGEGQDRSDKSLYKAITGARKYGLASLFNIATCDDAEIEPPADPPSPNRPAPKANAKTEKSEFVVKVEKWMGVQPEDRASAWKALKNAGGFTEAGQLSPGETDLFKKFVEECMTAGDFTTAIKGASK